MAKLVPEGKDSCYLIENKPVIIGRYGECDIVLQDNQASKRHCEIGKENNSYYLKDLNSFNGTYLNEKRISSVASVKFGDKIKIGKTIFVFLEDKEESSPIASSCPEMNTIKPSPVFIIKTPKQKMRSILLHEEKYSIGRKEILNDICIKDTQISSQHAQILQKEDGWWIYDLKSKNGVFVNNQSTECSLLKNGDKIRLGDTLCVFQYPRKTNSILPKCIAIALVLFLMILVFIGQSFFQYNRSHLALLPGNLLEDFSFEGGLSWECRGKMQIVESTARSGKFSLFYSSQNEFSYHEDHESQYWEAIEISYGKAYSISAWMKYKGLKGVAGIRIVWFDKKQKLFEEYSPLSTGEKEKWEKTEFSIFPPPSATSFQVICFAIGKADSLYFDDIYIKETEALESHLSVQNLGIHLLLDSKGIFQIYQQWKHWMSFGRFYIWEKEKEERIWVGSQEFSQFKVKKQDQDYIAQGTIHNFQGNRNFSIKIKCQENKEDFSFLYILKGIPDNRNYIVEYIFPFPGEFLEKESETTKADRIILAMPGTKNKIGFFYPKVHEYRITKDSQYIRFCFSMVPDENNEYRLEFKLKTNFKEDISRLEEWKTLAQKHYKENKLGKAVLCYESIMEHMIFHPFAMIARERKESLNSLFQEDLHTIASLLQHAQFFHNETVYDNFFVKCQEIISKWEGIAAVEDIKKILSQGISQKESIHKARQEKKYLDFLKKAESLVKQKNLACLFYEKMLEDLQDKTKESFLIEKIQSLRSK